MESFDHLDRRTRFSPDDGHLYDVVAVNIKTGLVTKLMAAGKSLPNAEAVVRLAVFRRGVDEEFYSEVPVNLYKEGDQWKGNGREV